MATDGEPSENIRRPADHLLSILISHWKVTEHRDAISRQDSYKGPLASLEPSQAAALLEEALWYFDLFNTPYVQDPWQGGRAHGEVRFRSNSVVRQVVSMISEWGKLSTRQRQNRWEKFEDTMREWRRLDGAELVDGLQPKFTPAGDGIAYEHMTKRAGKLKVYFIGADEGPVKIGISADPKGRLATLNTASPVRLSILALCDGSADLECEYHSRFSGCRINGEWFERTPELLAEIERLNASPTQTLLHGR